MNDSLPPEQWRPMFDAIGCEFGYRPLAKRIGMDHTRLRRLIRGGGTSADAIHQVYYRGGGTVNARNSFGGYTGPEKWYCYAVATKSGGYRTAATAHAIDGH